MHSHQIGDKVIFHHDHVILNQIKDVTDELEKTHEQNMPQNQILQFDQIKMINQEAGILSSKLMFASERFACSTLIDQGFYSLSSPPPDTVS